MDYKSKLSANNTALQDILNTINDFPSSSGGAGGLGRKMYSFGVLSDIHLRYGTGVGSTNYNYRNGIDDFNRAIPALQNLGVEFVCIAGDVGYDSKVEELQLYKTALETYATVPFYSCTGNHDYSHTDEIWEEYVGHPLNHEFIKDGDVFLFMSLVQTSSAAEQATPYSTSLTWLKERLTIHKGSRIFVFMHYPLTGYAGLRDGTYYGFSSGSTEDNELLASLIATKNVVVFSGHTHYKFAVEEDYYTMNVFNFTGKEVSLVHVPSSAYPRNSSHSEEADLSEGYVVDVYENAVILRGVDLVTGAYMANYVYELTNGNNSSASSGAILVKNDISLNSYESVEVEVTLSAPANVDVSVTESNDYISVSPTTLTFTEENYNVPQKIVISTENIEGSHLATIALSAEGFADKMISVTLLYESVTKITGKMIPENGAIYGDECGDYSSGYQLTTDEGGEFNFTLRNLNLKSSATAIYMSSISSITTINLEGVNTLDTSGTATAGQRSVSSSGTSGNYIIGNGEGAELILKNPANSTAAVIKGYWIIENAVVTAIGTMDSASGGINVVADGMVLHKNGTFSLGTSESTLATVQLFPCDNGYLDVKLGAAKAGATALTITPYADSGYTLTAIKVNGVEQPIGTALTMPNVGETLTIQGVFA